MRDDDGSDTALARLLHEGGVVEFEVLRDCLDEVRRQRSLHPEITLGRLLIDRGLTGRETVEAALLRLAQDPTSEAGDATTAASPLSLGPYRIVRELARGGMGAVHEAVHEQTGARFALKTLLPGLLSVAGNEDLERFRREAEVMGRFDHPHVARVHAAQLEGPTPYLVQAFLAGGTLQERIKAGPLEIDEAVEIVSKLGRGLQHCHERGVLHRDLKPLNVMFDERGEPQLVDFGLAGLPGGSASLTRLTQSGTIMGTPAYMAPEQARDSKAVDARTDLYGLGGILYAMLTGQAPFQSDGMGALAFLLRIQEEAPRSIRELRPDAPAYLVAICEHMLEKDPGSRYQSAEELLQALRAGAAGAPRRPSRRLALVLAMLVAPVIFVAVLGRDPATPEAPQDRSLNPLAEVAAPDPEAEFHALRTTSDRVRRARLAESWLAAHRAHPRARAVRALLVSKPLRTLPVPGASQARFVADGLLLTTGYEGLQVWNVESGREVAKFPEVRLPEQEGGFRPASRISVSADCKRALIGGGLSPAWLIDAPFERLEPLAMSAAKDVAISPVGSLAVIAEFPLGGVRVVSLPDGNLKKRLLVDVTSHAVAIGDRHVAAHWEPPSHQQTKYLCRAWSWPAGEPLGQARTLPFAARLLAFAPGDGALLLGFSNGTLLRLPLSDKGLGEPEPLRSGDELREKYSQRTAHSSFSRVTGLRFLKDRLLSVSGNETPPDGRPLNHLRIWDSVTGTAQAKRLGRPNGYRDVDVSPDGRFLVVACREDGVVEIWHTEVLGEEQ